MSQSIPSAFSYFSTIGCLLQVFHIIRGIYNKLYLQNLVFVAQECNFLSQIYKFTSFPPGRLSLPFSGNIDRDLAFLQLYGLVRETGSASSMVITNEGESLQSKISCSNTVVNEQAVKRLADVSPQELRIITMVLKLARGIESIKEDKKFITEKDLMLLGLSRQDINTALNKIKSFLY